MSEKDKKKCLVLLSTYNGEKYIEEQLNSIFSQKDVQVTCLVRDDSSTDSTRKKLMEYSEKQKNLSLIFGDENLGYSRSFFELILMANMAFDYYAFADQDDYWLPEKLIRGISKISSKDCLGYCSNLIVTNENLEGSGLLFDSNPIPTNALNRLVNIASYGCTIIVSSRGMNRIREYQKKIEVPFDYWIGLLLSTTGGLYYDNKSYIYYRQHGGNVIGANGDSSKSIKFAREAIMSNRFSNIARILVENYGIYLEKTDKLIYSLCFGYLKSLKKKVQLLVNPELKRQTAKGTLFIKFLVLFSKF